MAKAVAEQSNAFSIFWLKKQGYLPFEGGSQWGSIKWTIGGEERSSIQFQIVLEYHPPKDFEHYTAAEKDKLVNKVIYSKQVGETEKEEYIKLSYTHTNHWTNEKSDMDFRISLVTTPCNYGGVRYWFICPLSKNGQYCGRRVGVIYSIGKWFGCRHCGNIAYQSQMYGGRNKGFVSIPDIDKAEEQVKRYYYNGKPTRKYKHVIKLNDKFDNGLLMIAARFDRRFKRFASNKK